MIGVSGMNWRVQLYVCRFIWNDGEWAEPAGQRWRPAGCVERAGQLLRNGREFSACSLLFAPAEHITSSCSQPNCYRCPGAPQARATSATQ